MPIVYLNGDYVDLTEAKVSVEDRGFLFGDGVYEVVRYYHGCAFRLDDHLRRLAHSAAGVRLALPDAARDLPAIIEQVLTESSPSGDGEVYIQCTRGVAHPRSHPFPTDAHPTLLVMPIPLHAPPKQALSDGLSVITAPDRPATVNGPARPEIQTCWPTRNPSAAQVPLVRVRLLVAMCIVPVA